MPSLVELNEVTLGELERQMGLWGQPPFRARQVLNLRAIMS